MGPKVINNYSTNYSNPQEREFICVHQLMRCYRMFAAYDEPYAFIIELYAKAADRQN